jgi:uncharacterized damage-inducible protein DinB
MQRDVALIHDQLQRAFIGPAWHGPSVKALLAGVSAATAAARPIAGGHSIWEIVRHIGAWKTFVQRRLEGEPITSVPADEDWPTVLDTTDAAWAAALADLESVHQAFLTTVAGLDADRLAAPLASEPGTVETVYTTVLGVGQHDLYHAGQIATLKRAAESGSDV